MLTLTVQHVSMPMRAAFGHARATRAVADNVVVTLELDGVAGVGECVPREYVTGETIDSVLLAITALDVGALEREVDTSSFVQAVRSIERLRLPERLARAGRPGLAAACAVELALLDALGKRFQTSLRTLAEVLELPATVRQAPGQLHPVTHTLDFTRTPEEFLRGLGRVPRHLKVKLGRGRDEDVARIRAVRETLGEDVGLAVDANMAWSLEQAVDMVQALLPYRVSWYEEPLRQGALDDYRALRQRTSARIMLDESLCSFQDAQAALAAEACDLFNVRISKCGGLIPSLRLAELAHAHHLSIQLGAQIGEMAVLSAAARQFASAVRGLVGFEGSGVDRRFAEQLTNEVLTVDRERWVVEDLPGSGLGVTLNPAILRACTQRNAAWREGRWTYN